jgi:hypothetical protein
MEALIGGSLVFYQLSKAKQTTLLAMLVMATGVAAMYFWMQNRSSLPSQSPSQLSIDPRRREVASDAFNIATVSKKQLAFLKENQELMRIARDIRFVSVFDKARFEDILIHMDKMQKVYMYILAGRYYPRSYVPTFVDLRALIQEMLYSLVLITPDTFKNVYGISDPLQVVHRNIDAFTVISRRMLTTLQSYSADKGYIIPEDFFHPYEPSREHRLP